MKAAINIDKHIGSRIRARRDELGLLQAGLADLVKTSEVQMSRYESGTTPVKPELMAKLAKALRVDVTYFLEGL